MLFVQEIRLANSLKVSAQEVQSRSGCPYLKIRGSKGQFVHVVPAKGFQGHKCVHVYHGAHYGDDSFNVYMGMSHILSVRQFIKAYARSRVMDRELYDIGLFPV